MSPYSSGEEAAPVTAMAAESALQVVEKLQARLATNADPKKVSERAAGRVRRGAGVGRGAHLCLTGLSSAVACCSELGPRTTRQHLLVLRGDPDTSPLTWGPSS